MNIREATIQDIDQLMFLYSEQFEVMADLLPYLNQSGSQDRQFIKSTIVNDDSQIFVAENDTVIVGFVSIFEKESSNFNFRVYHKYAYIMDIIVTKKFRGNGIARKLMDKARQWAEERKLDYMELSVLSDNPAVNFYHKLHFEETVQTMVCKL